MIEPGATIAILGGGQLGRMTGMAARSLGYDVRVLDPDPHCPASAVASRVIAARFDDADAAAELARDAGVVTLEIEQIGLPALQAAAALAPLRPGIRVVHTIQDRIRQKSWLDGAGFPVGPWRTAASASECERAVAELGASVVKSPTGGYDGRGQVRVKTPREAADAWRTLGERPCVVEQFLQIEQEISVLVARSAPNGATNAHDTLTFPISVNVHEVGILDWSMLGVALPHATATAALEIARGIANGLDVEGLLAVELFVLRDRRVLVNELAPRPHNTFHSTERACPTSQFEQLVRAVCGLPLGAVEPVQPAAIANLLGDLWNSGANPDFAAALRVPTVRLHLYGKASARPGRKMGHVAAVGATPAEALERARAAFDRLTA